jgi:outer membrane lipase/esterase
MGSDMKSKILGMLAVALLAGPMAAGSALATTIFGDSLSDTGNIFLATGGATPAAPYFNGRFSNGPVWVETLAAGLGNSAHAAPSLAGGRNYAFGGARTGTGSNPPGVLAQIGGLWGPTNPVVDPTELFVLSGGMNDMRDARSAFSGIGAADDAGRQAAAQQAINNLLDAVGLLYSSGAREVLITNLWDLGLTPEASFLGLQFASTDATNRFNALMPSLLSAGTALGLNMYFLDVNGLFNQVRDDALNNGGSLYGITNVSSPCGAFTGSIGISCDVSLFSDALHFSARFHNLLGSAALALVSTSQVPEPGSLALLSLGLAGLGLSRRRKAD